MKVLSLTFSQSGQSQRAAQVICDSIKRQVSDVEVLEVDLERAVSVDVDISMPWSFLRFIRALPSSLDPVGEVEVNEEVSRFEPDLVVIGYPVWFLSPVPHLSLFLEQLPESMVRNTSFLTVTTCRNMWFEAQRLLRRTIEARGGKVVAHATLQDRGSTLATFVTTPYFFLTGRRRMKSRLFSSIFPEFGVSEADFVSLEGWVDQFFSGSDAHKTHFRFKAPLALSGVVGRRIFSALLFGWPMVAGRGRLLESLYLVVTMMFVAVGIITLMPPLAILSKLPPLRGKIKVWPAALTTEGAEWLVERLSQKQPEVA